LTSAAVGPPDGRTRASAKPASRFDIIERSRLIRDLLNLYGADPDVQRDLELLGELADTVPGVPPLLAGSSPQANAYRTERDALAATYGLDRIPPVSRDRDPFGFPCLQPSGVDFLDRWCARRYDGRPLPPSRLGDAAGYFGELPAVSIAVQADWELAGNRAETRTDFVRRVNAMLKHQIDAGLRAHRQAGRTFGGPPPTRRDVHLRWLFERLRYSGTRGQYPKIAHAAALRGELPTDADPESAEFEVTRAVTTLGDALGVRVRSRKER